MKILSRFPGINQTRGNQPKLLKKIFGFLIEKQFLADKICYSRKSAKKPVAFIAKANVVSLLQSIAVKIDRNYDFEDLKLDLRDKIIKHAGE